MSAESRHGNTPTDAERRAAYERERAAIAAERAASAQLGAHILGHPLDGTTDLLRAGAQGMASHMANTYPGRTVTLACVCGATQQQVTEYSFDQRGRLLEAVLWGIVRVLEHVSSTPSTDHRLAELVVI